MARMCDHRGGCTPCQGCGACGFQSAHYPSCRLHGYDMHTGAPTGSENQPKAPPAPTLEVGAAKDFEGRFARCPYEPCDWMAIGGTSQDRANAYNDHLKTHTVCLHDWIDASNSVVSNTAFCPGCKGIAELTDVTLTALSLDQLRSKYPDVNWKRA